MPLPDPALQSAIQHHRAGRLAEAETIYRQLLAANPNHADALHLLGVIAAAVDRQEEAIGLFDQAIRLVPDYSAAFLNLAIALHKTQRCDEAEDAIRRCLQLRPDFFVAWGNFGNMLKDWGKINQSISAFQTAIRIQPEYGEAWHNLIYSAPFHPDISPNQVLAEARKWSERFEHPLKTGWIPHPNNRDPDRQLRVGYLSPDFNGHVVGWNLLPLLKNHDRSRFEIYCYSTTAKPDRLTEILQSHTDSWRDILTQSDADVAGMIRADAIDILVDLSAHMAHNRLGIFARKPAPVQVTYLGCCGTTGMDAMDFRLSDPFIDPPGSDLSCYCEQTLLLAKSFWCYEPGPAPDVSDRPQNPDGSITFACLNNFAKVSPAALELWIRILQSVPRSRLLLHAVPGRHRRRPAIQLRDAGVDPDRLEFIGLQPREQYLQTYQRVDIALDPFPYNGGITTCDTLWMGVPLITLRGPAAIGRFGVSILSNVGLPELIADTPEHYISLAADLAGNPARRADLRRNLPAQMINSDLMNGSRFAADIESAYRDMWKLYLAGKIRGGNLATD